MDIQKPVGAFILRKMGLKRDPSIKDENYNENEELDYTTGKQYQKNIAMFDKCEEFSTDLPELCMSI